MRSLRIRGFPSSTAPRKTLASVAPLKQSSNAESKRIRSDSPRCESDSPTMMREIRSDSEQNSFSDSISLKPACHFGSVELENQISIAL
jgi:hypothetical protein